MAVCSVMLSSKSAWAAQSTQSCSMSGLAADILMTACVPAIFDDEEDSRKPKKEGERERKPFFKIGWRCPF